jgi:hypothetical protein
MSELTKLEFDISLDDQKVKEMIKTIENYKDFTPIVGDAIDGSSHLLSIEEEKVLKETKEYWNNRLLNPANREIDSEKLKFYTESVYKMGGYSAPKTIMCFKDPKAMVQFARTLTGNPEFSEFSYYCNISDYGWVGFYDFYLKIGLIKDSILEHYIGFLKCNVFDSILLTDVALYLSIPEIKFNTQNQLHCEDGPAVKWVDNDAVTEIYAWKDKILTKEIILEHDKVTVDMLRPFAENAETRRCCIEAMGVFKYFSVIDPDGLKVIDEGLDSFNYPMKLMFFKFENRTIQVLEVTCPSTGRVYNLYPPKNCKNVYDAKASTFGLTQEEFQPVIES